MMVFQIGARRRAWMPVVAGVVVTALLGGVVALAAGDALRPAVRVGVVPVVFDRAAVVEPGAEAERVATKSVQAPGWLEADPFYIACSALADGVVEEILVLEGDRVEKGQVVARLVADDARLGLRGAEAAVATARALLASAEGELESAEMTWANPIERDRALGISLGALDGARAELAQLPSVVEAERATLARIEEELARLEAALASGAATDIEVIIKRKEAEAQRARVRTAELREGILVSMVARLEADHEAAVRHLELRIEEKRALDLARALVEERRAGVVHAEAARDEAALRLERMTIRSPLTGFVQARLKVPGDKVMLAMDSAHSTHVVHVYDPESLQVRVDVPLAEAAHIRVGQACEVVVDVLPDTVFRGEVTRITHEADLQKNTLQAKVRVMGPSALLRPEMLTRVKFLGDSSGRERGAGIDSGGSVLIPVEACHDLSDGRGTLWVVRDRRGDFGITDSVAVRVVGEEGGMLRVDAPVQVGDLLITNAHEPGSGQRVRMVDAGGAA